MKYIKSILLLISIFLILNLIVTLFSYFNLVSDKGINILKSIVFIVTFLVSGFYIGFNSKNKGYIEGIKLGLIFILISIFIILVLPSLEFSLPIIIYYLVIIILSVIGSTIGINIKRQSK